MTTRRQCLEEVLATPLFNPDGLFYPQFAGKRHLMAWNSFPIGRFPGFNHQGLFGMTGINAQRI